MYGFPPSLSPDIFVDKCLTSILFAEYLVALDFDGQLHIDVYSTLSHDSPGEFAELWDLESPVLTTRLPRLLGHRVVAADLEGRGTICLSFDTGEVLKIYDDTDWYECYHIEIPGQQRYII